MANSSINLPQFNQTVISLSNFTNPFSLSFPANSKVHLQFRKINTTLYQYRLFSRRSFLEYEDEDDLNSENYSFQEAVALFNNRDYYRCHDVLEALWNESQEPIRTLLHGVLQCAVGFHHLFNQNHKGAMMELGEGVCKLRKFNFEDGPFYELEKEISQVLDFIYTTQLEVAACGDDICVTLDQSERSYQLLGGYAAGQKLYRLENDQHHLYLVFSSGRSNCRIKLPTIHASEGNLKELEYI